ncbi:MAG: transglycosylase SLT domain-containing protein [Rubrivivax sp.]|nr:transglycosylase SLT domain-containing protein [Rubrivivax sp.]
MTNGAAPAAFAASLRALALALALCLPAAQAQFVSPGADVPSGAVVNPAVAAALALQNLPRPAIPPPERGEVVPAQVARWRDEARAFEYGEGVPRDALRAAELYCRAARYGDAEAQYSLAWMLTNARGIERNDATAAHLFAAAAEQGHPQARNMAARLGTPMGPPPPCLRPPEADGLAQIVQQPAEPAPVLPGLPGARPAAQAPASEVFRVPQIPRALLERAPIAVSSYVQMVAPEYRLEPALVLAVMAAESNFDPGAVSAKNAQGLMQLLPETARRFGVRNVADPAQNIRGGMAYLRWLLAYFEGDLALALAAYNAGEGAVERYLGVPPFAETRNYVLKILLSLNGRRVHGFDASQTPPSGRLAAMREYASAGAGAGAATSGSAAAGARR